MDTGLNIYCQIYVFAELWESFLRAVNELVFSYLLHLRYASERFADCGRMANQSFSQIQYLGVFISITCVYYTDNRQENNDAGKRVVC